MDVLEKALLVDELKHLIVGLNDNKASLFEIAKSKKRIKDICASCNDPLFQEELAQFKQYIQQEEVPSEELAAYGFSMTYYGTYNFSEKIEHALFAAPDMGWATLRQANHWQVWVVRPALSFLKSPWMDSSKEALVWLTKHAKQYVKTDEQLKQIIPILEPISEAGLDSTTKATQTETKDVLTVLKEKTANFDAQLEAIIQEKLQTAPPIAPSTPSVASRPKPSFKSASRPTANLEKIKPLNTEFNLDGLVCRLERVDPKVFPSLYHVDLHDEINQNIKIDWLYLKAENDEQPIWETAQIFLAEQLYAQGQFSHYVVLIGTHSVEYATSVLQTYTDQRHTRTSSIHQTHWTTFKQHYHQHETLFNECIMNGHTVWQRDEDAYPYIPASFINTQKFIPFDETAANFLTPIILLKERQKIRVIHGLERIKLSSEDQAYPFLLLDRTNGYTWQLIRQVISSLAQPISVHALYDALAKADVSA